MNKKQLVQLIREQRPEPPRGYEAHIEHHLHSLTGKSRSVQKRYKLSTLLVAVILLIAVLAGTAFAASMLGIFDFFKGPANPITPLDGAEDMVTTNPGVSEAEYATLTVEEAVFDGQGILVKCRLTPNDTRKHAMYNSFMQDTPEDIYILETEYVIFETGSRVFEVNGNVISITNLPDTQQLSINGEPTEIPTKPETALEKGIPVFIDNGTLRYSELQYPKVTGRKDGRQTIGYWIDITVEDDIIFLDECDAQEQSDGSIFWWQSGMADETLNVDSVDVHVSAQLYNTDETSGEIIGSTYVDFTLPLSGNERIFSIVPAGGNTERFDIISGSLSLNKMRGYLNVCYTYNQAEDEDMGITFHIYDTAGNSIPTGYSNSSIAPDADGLLWCNMEIQSFEEVPSRLLIEAKVIGADKTLGIAECLLIENP